MPLKKWIKSKLRSFAIRLLAFNDDSFPESTNRKHLHNDPVDSKFSRPSEEFKDVIVVNDEGIVASEEALELLFAAILKVPSLGDPQRELLSELKRSGLRLPASYDDVATALTSNLISKLNVVTPSQRDAEMLALAANHVRLTNESRSAYRTEKKLNPNAVYWPDPTDPKNPRSQFSELPFAREAKILDATTPIGSSGSCFAIEIARRLQAQKFNYIVTEPAPEPETGFSTSSARWGIVFNTPSFRQMVERAFGVKHTPRILWSRKWDGKQQFLDPFREDITFGSRDEYLEDYPKHIDAVRAAMLKTKVFVLTLGMNEVWRLKSDGSVFSRAPWRISADLVERWTMTALENVNELQGMLELWRSHNPEIQFIVSVSPVPLHATFVGERRHVIEANFLSKATLRVAAEQFASLNDGVHYFPSYETVMYCTESAWAKDQRHVSKMAIDNVMNLFHKMYVRNQ